MRRSINEALYSYQPKQILIDWLICLLFMEGFAWNESSEELVIFPFSVRLPPVWVVLIQDVKDIALDKGHSKLSTWNVVIFLRIVGEMRSNVHLRTSTRISSYSLPLIIIVIIVFTAVFIIISISKLFVIIIILSYQHQQHHHHRVLH